MQSALLTTVREWTMSVSERKSLGRAENKEAMRPKKHEQGEGNQWMGTEMGRRGEVMKSPTGFAVREAEESVK